jgi:hypothetical protein
VQLKSPAARASVLEFLTVDEWRQAQQAARHLSGFACAPWLRHVEHGAMDLVFAAEEPGPAAQAEEKAAALVAEAALAEKAKVHVSAAEATADAIAAEAAFAEEAAPAAGTEEEAAALAEEAAPTEEAELEEPAYAAEGPCPPT